MSPPDLKYKGDDDKFDGEKLVTGEHLKDMSKESIDHLDNQDKKVEAFQKEVKSLVYKKAGEAAKTAGPDFLLILILFVVFRARESAQGRIKWVATAYCVPGDIPVWRGRR